MEGWNPADVSFDEHVIHSPDCAWVICQCIRRKFADGELPFSWDDTENLPTSRKWKRLD